MTEAELVQAALDGDREAFGDLVIRQERVIHAIVRGYLGNDSEVPDLVQESFVKAYRNLSALRAPGQFGPWLRSIAINTAVSWLRSKKPEIALNDPDEADLLPELDAPPIVSDDVDRLLESIQQLPVIYRAPLVMKYLGDLSYQEIAETLGVSTTTVDGRIATAKKMLRRKLT